MKNSFELKFALIIFLGLTIVGCSSIPKIQIGDYVSKITETKVELENGKSIRMSSKKLGEPTTFVLVRHAEKMKDSKNPDLTPEGKIRAEKLSTLLSGIKLDHIFSSDYNRTKQTAEPTSKSQNQEVNIYNVRKLEDFANTLLSDYSGKKVLVTGHSNSTPTLLNHLMGEKVAEQIDESDYENLFLFNVYPNGTKKVVMVKF